MAARVYRIDLPEPFGSALFGPDSPGGYDYARAYDHLGNRLAWALPRGQVGACDVERQTGTRSWLANAYGMSDQAFLASWVQTETVAKMLDVPIMTYVRAQGLIQASEAHEQTIRLNIDGANIDMVTTFVAYLDAWCCFGMTNSHRAVR